MAPEAVKLSFTLRDEVVIDITQTKKQLRKEIVKIIKNTVESMARKLGAHMPLPNASAFAPLVGGSTSGSGSGSLASDVFVHVVVNLPNLTTKAVNGDVVIKPRPEVDLSLVALAEALAEHFATEFEKEYKRAKEEFPNVFTGINASNPSLRCLEAHAVVKPTLDRYLPKKTRNGIQIMTPSTFNSNTLFFADKSQLPLALAQHEGVRYYVDPNFDEEFDFTHGVVKWNDQVRGVDKYGVNRAFFRRDGPNDPNDLNDPEGFQDESIDADVQDLTDGQTKWIKVELEAVQGLKAWLQELNIQTKHDDALNYLTCVGADRIEDAFDFGVQPREEFFAALGLTEIEEARVRVWVKNKFQVAAALPKYSVYDATHDANVKNEKAAMAAQAAKAAWKRAQEAKIAWESAKKKQRFGP